MVYSSCTRIPVCVHVTKTAKSVGDAFEMLGSVSALPNAVLKPLYIVTKASTCQIPPQALSALA